MGLIGDTIDSVGDSLDRVYDGIEDAVGGGDDPEPPQDDDSIGDTIGDTEDSINDDAGDVGDSIDEGLDGGTDTVFDFAQGGFDALEGLLNWVAGFGDTINGVGEFIQNNGDLIPVAGDGIQLVGAFFGGTGDVIAGFFHGLASSVSFVEGFFAFVSTLNGWEGAGFLLGSLLIGISVYLVVSAISSGQFLLLPSFIEDVGDAALGFWVGLGLVTWSAENLIGGVVLAGTGVILLFFAINSDRGSLITFGAPTALLGFPLLFAALEFGLLANLLFTAASIYGTWFGIEYLENRLGPRVSDDRAVLVGEN